MCVSVEIIRCQICSVSASATRRLVLTSCTLIWQGYLGYTNEPEVHAWRRFQFLDTTGVHRRVSGKANVFLLSCNTEYIMSIWYWWRLCGFGLFNHCYSNHYIQFLLSFIQFLIISPMLSSSCRWPCNTVTSAFSIVLRISPGYVWRCDQSQMKNPWVDWASTIN